MHVDVAKWSINVILPLCLKLHAVAGNHAVSPAVAVRSRNDPPTDTADTLRLGQRDTHRPQVSVRFCHPEHDIDAGMCAHYGLCAT